MYIFYLTILHQILMKVMIWNLRSKWCQQCRKSLLQSLLQISIKCSMDSAAKSCRPFLPPDATIPTILCFIMAAETPTTLLHLPSSISTILISGWQGSFSSKHMSLTMMTGKIGLNTSFHRNSKSFTRINLGDPKRQMQARFGTIRALGDTKTAHIWKLG